MNMIIHGDNALFFVELQIYIFCHAHAFKNKTKIKYLNCQEWTCKYINVLFLIVKKICYSREICEFRSHDQEEDMFV